MSGSPGWKLAPAHDYIGDLQTGHPTPLFQVQVGFEEANLGDGLSRHRVSQVSEQGGRSRDDEFTTCLVFGSFIIHKHGVMPSTPKKYIA